MHWSAGIGGERSGGSAPWPRTPMVHTVQARCTARARAEGPVFGISRRTRSRSPGKAHCNGGKTPMDSRSTCREAHLRQLSTLLSKSPPGMRFWPAPTQQEAEKQTRLPMVRMDVARIAVSLPMLPCSTQASALPSRTQRPGVRPLSKERSSAGCGSSAPVHATAACAVVKAIVGSSS